MSVLLGCLIWLSLHGVHAQLITNPSLLEDAKLDTLSLIEKYGYPAENHTIETDDGYLITIHRIPRPGAVPVLLLHGLLDSSATWVMMGPNNSLGYLLYERGYDVWLGNVRGNTYGREHRIYKPNHDEFWDFTFHEMGIYDVPNTIDYILKKTNRFRLNYIGHSQGTMAFWVMGSERPKYMSKIIFMQALAPMAYFNYATSPLLLDQKLEDTMKEFLPDQQLIEKLSKQLCAEESFNKIICTNLLLINVGFNPEQINETMLPVIIGHVPAGTSTKLIQHLGQIRSLNSFQQFDYGLAKNLLHYNSVYPPKYNLAYVNAWVTIFNAENDWLAQPEDVLQLTQELTNVLVQHQINSNFSHMDFVWGVDAQEMIWNGMIDYMDKRTI